MRRAIGLAVVFTVSLGSTAIGQDEAPATREDGWLLGRIMYAAPTNGTPWAGGGGLTETTDVHDAAQFAAMEALGVEPEAMVFLTWTLSDPDGDVLLMIHGVSVDGGEDQAMLDGLLAWQSADWADRFGVIPVNEPAIAGDKDVLRAEFGLDPKGWPYPHPYCAECRGQPSEPELGEFYAEGDSTGRLFAVFEDTVQYLYAGGESAIAVTAPSDELALAYLELLP